MRRILGSMVTFVILVGAGACVDSAPKSDAEQLSVRIVDVHPHDPTAFTQGLVFDGDQLIESTGLNGSSSIRLVETDGAVADQVDLAKEYFAEGAGVLDGEIVQLTWTSGLAFRWDAVTLEPLGQYAYEGEGWGLTFDQDQDRWIQSDGSATLTFRSADDFSETGTVDVTLDGEALDLLNELEWVDGQVWANVWKTTDIVRIDPSSGEVTAVVDAATLVPRVVDDPQSVLNGIAHRPGDPVDQLWLTGKNWPTYFEVQLVPS